MAVGDTLPSDSTARGTGERRRSFTGRGIALVVGALISSSASFAILLGLTPIAPVTNVVIALALINLFFVLCLIAVIGVEIRKLLKARERGRAAARLHVRIVGLFSIVAITPAILVAIVASFTLNVGLDRWFSMRTQSIVNQSLDVAQAYVMENARYLQGQTVTMATELDKARSLYNLDRTGFNNLLTRQARGRGFLGAFVVTEDGNATMQADIQTERPLPAIPKDALQKAVSGEPTLIPPGVTNLVGAVIKLRSFPDMLLYTVRAVDPSVIHSMREMEQTTQEYHSMEEGRTPLQIAFAILYLGFALIVLLAAIWTAIAVADRLVRPIRLLIGASDDVAKGNLQAAVPVRASDGDVGNLSKTFNNMIVQIRTQRNEILEAKDQIDERRRFSEAVLSGVSAGVVGVAKDGRVSIANRSAETMFACVPGTMVGMNLLEIAPEFREVVEEHRQRRRKEHRKQITMVRGGKERTLNVQITGEDATDARDSFVITVDDITDLVIAQRSTAWADVARRIAHEIKNPLTPIQLSAERIRRRYGKQIAEEDRAVFDQCTQTIVRQVEDIGRMVDEFSSFARMPKPAKEEVDLRVILKDAVFLREMGTHKVDFTSDFGETPLVGRYDSRMLGQAFGNLIKNAGEAIEAVPEGEERDGRRIAVYAHSEGEYATVDVIDNGKGLPPENRHRILEPYMTMREKGTGLGLAIVKKIIEDHGGVLELHDAPADFDRGRGAMFTVKLPQGTGTAEPAVEREEAGNGV
ncbi:sensor histidine kinase NtrY-like [Pararhizobium mangrovi]|uniref:histidine kinase n=1 Tax=Pararhizobium mangrovi TaxID=2590452 RepID=A0A506UGS3_9HYPH|nr:PAS domain-containing sensor histidine kinase [Pararhizobium mangrovi]TPW31347.1 PAS domain-containing sensor histidine kinase [Pararhizobium mangrovi]